MPAFADDTPIQGSEQSEQDSNWRRLSEIIAERRAEIEAELLARETAQRPSE
jgi:hypothetical protein